VVRPRRVGVVKDLTCLPAPGGNGPVHVNGFYLEFEQYLPAETEVFGKPYRYNNTFVAPP
jgi:hypothetical protein